MLANGESRLFEIARGAKQSDPISPPLVNVVLEGALEPVKKQWLEGGRVIPIGKKKDGRLLSLRFADDVLSVVGSLKVLKRTPEAMRQAVSKVGWRCILAKRRY